MDRRSERRDYRNRNDSCEDCQRHMRTPPVAPVEIVVHGQHLPKHESTQLPGAGSARVPILSPDPISPSSRGRSQDRPQAASLGCGQSARIVAAPAKRFLQTGLMPSAPRFRGLAVSASCRMGSGSDRFIASRRGTSFGSLGACEGLPQTVDRLSETCKLLREPLCVSLLRGEKAFHGLQLILNDLQLVDRFLLGSFQTPGFLHQLFGGLRSPNLQLAGSNDTLLFGGNAGVSAP